jgi:ubiquinol-cytochrome c reductase cytochrome b subunit
VAGENKSIITTPGKLIKRLFGWVKEQLSRTIFGSFKFIFPKRTITPFAFLGMLTFVCFALLGITGLYLMFYYEPSLEGAFDSVYSITNEVSYGFVIRNIHYHASNAMIFLAVMHCFYLLFKARYKLRNKLMWIDGVLIGLLAIMEAFTGYALIMNERAMFAMSIGQTLAADMHPLLSQIAMGGGSLSEFILRFYTLHVIAIPAIMILLAMIHFPRNLILDLPVISMVVGILFLFAGFLPVELGNKYFPGLSFGITVPEWYFSGIYAFLRTGLDRVLAALIIPAIFVGIITLIPLLDRNKKFKIRDRPLITAFGVASICLIILSTIWGSRSFNFVDPVVLDVDIPIDPIIFWFVSTVTGLTSFSITYFLVKRKSKVAKLVKKRKVGFYLLENEVVLLIATIVILQIALNYLAYQAYSLGYWENALKEWGVSFIGLSIALFGYRIKRPKGISLPRGRQETIVLSFKKVTSFLRVCQAVIVAYAWLLDPIFYKNQMIFGIIIGATLVIFALSIYLYRLTHRMSKEDYEWLAVGIAIVAQLILFVFFL